MKKHGFIVLISGPSGVGKGTILNRLLQNSELNLTFSVSMTTRQPRVGEKHGKDYFFVSKDEFALHLQNDNFLENATFVDNHYGTPRDYVYTLLEDGKNVLIEIEVVGAQTLMTKVPSKDLISFYVMPPSVDELINRLRNRQTEDEATILKRASRFKDELQYKDNYEYTIINDDLETCIAEITAIIKRRMLS